MGIVRKSCNRWSWKTRTADRRKKIFGSWRPKVKSWRLENSLMIAWLINSMEPIIGKSYLFLPTAKDMREAVRETYFYVAQIFELKIKLWQAKQDENAVLHIIMKWCPCGRS